MFSLGKVIASKDDQHEADCLFKEGYIRELGQRFPCLERDVRTACDVLDMTPVGKRCLNIDSLVPECLNLVNQHGTGDQNNLIQVHVLLKSL